MDTNSICVLIGSVAINSHHPLFSDIHSGFVLSISALSSVSSLCSLISRITIFENDNVPFNSASWRYALSVRLTFFCVIVSCSIV